MDEMIKDVEKISNHLLPILGNHFYALLNANDIFEMVEERQHEPSEERVANIIENIVTIYGEREESSVEFRLNNNLQGASLNATDASPVPYSISVDHHALVQHLSSMFPDTPIDYIWDQTHDLLGREAAVDRFIEQLLVNPLPPNNWLEPLLECECCYEGTPEDDLILCPEGHTFCYQCVKEATTVAMGDGKSGVECMSECREEISGRQLARALEPTLLRKLEQRRQREEVMSAGLEKLVSCPFCPYQAIMEDIYDKVFVCRNEECGIESCRKCGKVNHVPKRCEEAPEVEKARKRIEEKLTMSMLRECWQCKKLFYREGGCNHMTCSCGAQMCYICKLPMGRGIGDRCQGRCPQYQDEALHKKEVTEAAVIAKEEIALSNDLARVLNVDVVEGKVVLE